MNEFTVIVPVYNVEKYLRRCLDSILSQTFAPKKIILVDDGSTDSSGKICDEYAEKEKSIIVVHQKNQGLSAARNKGIDICRTELITFVDSDDYIENNMYEVMIKNMDSAKADMSICGVWTEKENGEKTTRRKTGIKKVWSAKEALIILNSYQHFNMSVWNVMFKRSLFEGENPLRFPVGKKCEDYYLMHQLIARVNRLVYDSNPYYHYVQRPNSISRNVKINLAPIGASLAQLDFYRKNYPDIAYVAETACTFSHMGIYTAYVRNHQKCPPKLFRKLKKTSRKFLPSVIKNPHIPRIKKFQALAFCYALPVYKYVIERTEHR
ncbi:MAG: glycosyltransferase [Ruminococcus flavefaciens]|nr:glycosyltransferase [Ruminococcus flavefaciens]